MDTNLSELPLDELCLRAATELEKACRDLPYDERVLKALSDRVSLQIDPQLAQMLEGFSGDQAQARQIFGLCLARHDASVPGVDVRPEVPPSLTHGPFALA